MNNDKNKKVNVNVGINFFGALQLLFIGAKLFNAINWSWWWVLSPIWMPTALAIAIPTLVVLVTAVVQGIMNSDSAWDRRRKRNAKKKLKSEEREKKSEKANDFNNRTNNAYKNTSESYQKDYTIKMQQDSEGTYYYEQPGNDAEDRGTSRTRKK